MKLRVLVLGKTYRRNILSLYICLSWLRWAATLNKSVEFVRYHNPGCWISCFKLWTFREIVINHPVIPLLFTLKVPKSNNLTAAEMTDESVNYQLRFLFRPS